MASAKLFSKNTTAKRSELFPEGGSQPEQNFTDSLKNVYWTEKALLKALPKMRKAATTGQLQVTLEDHIIQTKEHVSRLEQAFKIIGEKVQAKKSEVMERLIREGNSIIEETEKDSMTRDVAIITAAQKIEHYEIEMYGGLVNLAKTLGIDDAAEIFVSTLEEEKRTDQTLSNIAANNIDWEGEQKRENAGLEFYCKLSYEL